mgnify:CR=1 FL=1
MLFDYKLIDREEVIKIILEYAIENNMDSDLIIPLVCRINQLAYYDVQKKNIPLY